MGTRLYRFFELSLFGVLLLLVVGYLLLQSVWIQNKLAGAILGQISEDVHTEVSLKRIDLGLFDQVSLEGLLVRDLSGDTLLYAERAQAGVESNILTLLWGNLQIDQILLRGVVLKIKRNAGEYDNNAAFILNYLSPPKPRKNQKSNTDFFLALKNARLKDFKFLVFDAVKGQEIRGSLHQLEVRINAYDKRGRSLDLDYIQTSGLHLSYSEMSKQPLPPRSEDALSAIPEPKEDEPFHLRLGELSLEGTHLWYHNLQKSAQADPTRQTIDFNHLDLDRLNVYVRNLVGNSAEGWSGVLKEISAREYSGFVLSGLSADTLRLSSTAFVLDQMRLLTPFTDLGGSFRMNYTNGAESLKNFTDEVQMTLDISPDRHVGVRDIQFFSKPLSNNPFFKKNADRLIAVKGTLGGRVNRLRGRDLEIALDNQTALKGRFMLDNVARSADEMLLSVYFDELATDLSALRQMIPGFSPPDNFDKLGRLNYTGRYDLFYGTQHILQGNLNNQLGPAKLDMKLDLTGGRDAARYSGELTLRDFDLATWTGNSAFGRTSFSLQIDTSSQGLRLQSLNAKGQGDLYSLEYKGYKYQNVKVNGVFRDRVFDGYILTNEKDLALGFRGLVNLRDSVPVYNFSLDVARCDLYKLGFTQVPFQVSGVVERIDMVGNDLKSVTGEGLIRHLNYRYRDEPEQFIDSIFFEKRTIGSDGRGRISFRSQVASAELVGAFDLATLPRTLKQVFKQNFPDFACKLGVTADTTQINARDVMDISLSITDTKDLLRLVHKDLDTLKDVSVIGRIDGPTSLIYLNASAPRIKYAGVGFEGVEVQINTKGSDGIWSMDIAKTNLSKKVSITPIKLSGKVAKNALEFEFVNQSANRVLKQVNLKGALTARDSVWEIQFDPSNIALFNDQWTLKKNNYIRFGKGFFETQSFDLRSINPDATDENDKFRVIRLNSLNGKGLQVTTTNFNLNFLDNILKVRDIRYSGKIYDFDLTIRDVFKMEGLALGVSTDTLFIRDRPYGFIDGTASMENLREPIKWNLNMVDAAYRLVTDGAFIPKGNPSREVEGLGVIPTDGFMTQITANNFPFDLLSQYIPGISKLSGNFDINSKLGGKLNQIGVNGYLDINEGAFQLDYLKSMFHIKKQRITLTNDKIWADGDTIYDASLAQMAIVSGGLRHRYFNDWRLDVGIKSVGDRFMILNTTESDNSTYYGQGIGSVEAKFTGDFVRTNMDIKAVAKRDSRLYLPIDSYVDAGEASFIRFVNPNEKKDSTKIKTLNSDYLKGTQLDFDLSISRDAEVHIIIDRRAGDNVTGKGVGDINIKYDRTGRFSMFGQYEIEQGEYLFTLFNVFNKPFKVAKGGTITWYGDPYEALINLTATYDETTPVATLIQAELLAQNNSILANQARTPTTVNLDLKLSGKLFNPDVSFDISFPSLNGELRSIVENKIRSLRSDPNELNRQVFGIVVVGTFLPENSVSFISNADYVTTAVNSVTQMLSGQLSSFLSSFARDLLGNRVNSIDFNIAYNDVRSGTLSSTDLLNARELQSRLRFSLKDDRIHVEVGGQVGYSSANGNTDNILGGDIVVSMDLNESKQWRVKCYSKFEPTIISGSQRQQRYGAGITFNKEYDSFGHMMSGLTDLVRKIK